MAQRVQPLIFILIHPVLYPGKAGCRAWFNKLPSPLASVCITRMGSPGRKLWGPWAGRVPQQQIIAPVKWSLLYLTLSHFPDPFGPRDGDSSTMVGPRLLHILYGYFTLFHTFVISLFVNKPFKNYSNLSMSCFVLEPWHWYSHWYQKWLWETELKLDLGFIWSYS